MSSRVLVHSSLSITVVGSSLSPWKNINREKSWVMLVEGIQNNCLKKWLCIWKDTTCMILKEVPLSRITSKSSFLSLFRPPGTVTWNSLNLNMGRKIDLAALNCTRYLKQSYVIQNYDIYINHHETHSAQVCAQTQNEKECLNIVEGNNETNQNSGSGDWLWLGVNNIDLFKV